MPRTKGDSAVLRPVGTIPFIVLAAVPPSSKKSFTITMKHRKDTKSFLRVGCRLNRAVGKSSSENPAAMSLSLHDERRARVAVCLAGWLEYGGLGREKIGE